jgi:hypothetical protein
MTEEKPCRHEYVKIFQRRLKGLERRLVLTRGYLPIGFKNTDFGHLGEGSFCFCTKCRVRLYPRRTQAEKAAARLALAQKVPQQDLNGELDDLAGETAAVDSSLAEVAVEEGASQSVNVDELELTAVDVEDIEADGVKLNPEDDSLEVSEEDN